VLRLALCGFALVVAMIGGIAQAGTVQYVYDELGRLVAEVDAAGEVTVYTYDAAGNLVSVSRDNSSQLAIFAFAPTRGKAGDTVTLFGSGFVPSPAQNSVSFNGTPATVSTATANTLVVTAPSGVTSGPIAVSNTNGSTVSAQDFTVVVLPTVDSVTPSAVQSAVTVRLDIAGSHLAGVRDVGFEQPGITALILPGGTDALLPVSLQVAASVPLGTYGFSVTNDAGTTDSGAVAVTVTAALLGAATSVTRPLSVHLRAPTPGAPPGNAMDATRPVSVYLPAATPGAPAGNAMSVSGSVSVHLPATTPGAPAGNTMSVTLPVSVSMP
jgi:YD repeat-containing protein